jgi:hypothetical protein
MLDIVSECKECWLRYAVNDAVPTVQAVKGVGRQL